MSNEVEDLRSKLSSPRAHLDELLARVEQGARAVERDKIGIYLATEHNASMTPFKAADAIERGKHLLFLNPPASTMLTDEYQARLKALSWAMGGEPVRSMWLSGGPRDGWHLSGQRGGDFALPETKGCRTWHDALTSAEKWVAKP